mmetsp:Transcript_10433/g.25653  ORF Transcript_10433/g.25653 Transcript_10433/m.25653 type:complete len:220 (-) Transcript_10433:541-1200(-)
MPSSFTSMSLPSSCRTVRVKPVSASLREISMVMCRSLPLRVKMGWLFCFRLTITSPGTCPGDCSEAPLNRTSSPSGLPFSTVTLSSLGSFLQRYSDGTCCCCCTTKPGATCCWTIFTSGGHSPHSLHASVFQVLRPLHWRHTTRRLIDIDTSFPLYMSSSDTAISTLASGPLFTPRLPPPPKKASNGLAGAFCPFSCCSSPSCPAWSKTIRSSSLERIS